MQKEKMIIQYMKCFGKPIDVEILQTFIGGGSIECISQKIW